MTAIVRIAGRALPNLENYLQQPKRHARGMQEACKSHSELQ